MQRAKPDAASVPPEPANPPALVAFMLQGWKPARAKRPAKVPGLRAYAARRRALSARFAGLTLLIPAGHEKTRTNDTTFRFRASSEFYYYTGHREPDCVLALVPRRAGGHESVLFVEPNPGRTDPTFFTDRAKGELWVGPRLGIPQSRARFGVDRCEPIAALPSFVQSLRRDALRLLRGIDPELDALLRPHKKRDQAFAAALAEQRLVKERREIAAIERAGESTKRAFEEVIGALRWAKSERDVEGVFNARARADGNDVGFGTIAAAGADACILHWTRNDGLLRRGELLLLDAGVEGRELYTADVTRTLPVNGRFTKEQRLAYDLVINAQLAAFAAIEPGADFLAPHRAAMRVLAKGLEELGILPSAAEALAPENQFYKRYTLHGTSHMLGLDVHDCTATHYKAAVLAPGMVLTVEPGLYFQLDDLTVPRRFRGIGIRVEDDVVVTRTGCRVLTRLPREADDVEAWMRSVWARGS